MKLSELIQRLQIIQADLHAGIGANADIQVVAAVQESYPTTGKILGACVLQEDENGDPVLVNGKPVVWIAIGASPDMMAPDAPNAVFKEAQRDPAQRDPS